MASYLTTASIGEFDIKAYKADGIKYYDAIDPDLFTRPAPRTGRRFALSNVGRAVLQAADADDQRPAGRREAVVLGQPQHRAQLGLLLRRGAHRRARTTGRRCPIVNGHTSQDTGFVPASAQLHPFLEHYQRENADGGCDPQGTTGTWNAISGASDGYEQWVVDLTPYAGQADRGLAQLRQRRPSVTSPACSSTTSSVRAARARRRSRTGSTAGRTPARPRAASRTRTTWYRRHRGRRAATPRRVVARRTLARQPEIIRYLSGIFGPYPFSSAGAIVDDFQGLGFALENQTRAVYARGLFEDRTDPLGGESIVVHELAHQWTGDYLALAGVAAHLAQRGLRDLQRVAVERARGPRPGAGVLRRPRVDPGRRLLLGAGDRRPGPGRDLRRRGL